MNERHDDNGSASDDNPGAGGRRRHRGFGAVSLLLVGGLAGAGVATALGVAAHADRGHGEAAFEQDGGHGRHHGERGGHRGERMKERVAWMLGAVDATPEQRERIDALLDDMFMQVREMRSEGGELRRALIVELAGADVDRAELERIRGEFVAGVDTRSKTMLETMAGVSETLTPEQRATIAEHMASRGPRR